MDSFFRIRDKVTNLRDSTVRACLCAYVPPALCTIFLLAILIICSVSSSAVNGCYRQQLHGRQQDLLLNASEINILLLVERSGEFRSKLASVAKFIQVRYGRFIRTQLNFEISVSRQWDEEDKFVTELVDQMEDISQHPLVAHSEYKVSCETLESMTKPPDEGDSKKLKLHLIDKVIMDCATKILNLTSSPILAIMVENSAASFDIVSISNIVSHLHLYDKLGS